MSNYTVQIEFPDGNKLSSKRSFTPYTGSVDVKITADGKSVSIDFQTLRYLLDDLRNNARVAGKNL